jgi:PAS domain S-box-containing protein
MDSRSFLNAVSDAALLLRPDEPVFTIDQVNEAHLNITGYHYENVIGRGLFEVFTDDLEKNLALGAKTLKKSLQKVLRTGEEDEMPVYRYDIIVEGRDFFEERYWTTINSPVFNKKGDVEFILHIVKDVTESVLTERKFEKKSKEGERNVVVLGQFEEMAQMGSWEVDLKTNSIFWSDGVYAICGYKPDEFHLTFESALGVIHPEDRDKAVKGMQRAIKERSDYRIRKRFVGKGKLIREILSRGKVITDDQGEPVKLVGTFQDITERLLLEKSEAELAEENQKTKNLLLEAQDVAKIGGWEVDLIKGELHWSPIIKSIHEVDSDFKPDVEKAIGFYKEGYHRNQIRNAYESAQENGTPFNLELKIITAKANERWVRVTGKTEMERGECIRIYGATQDITHIKKAEEEKSNTLEKLKGRNKFIETALENLPIGIAVNRIDTGEMQLMNAKFSEIYGWPKEDLTDVNTFFKRIYPDPEYRAEISKKIIEDILSGDESRMEWKGITTTTKSGEKRIVKAKNIPLPEQNLMISTVIDTSDQAEKEKKLEQLSLVASKTTEIVMIMDPKGCIVWANNAFAEITGYKLDEVLGKGPGEFLSGPETDPVTEKRIHDALNEHRSLHVDIINYNKSGEKYWAEVRLDPVLDEAGNCKAFIAIADDITDRKKRDLQLLESLKEKEVLLAEIHHRVKNNLAVVSSMMQIQMLEEDSADADNRFIDSISRIKTIATIHEILYQSGSFSELDFYEIIEKLIANIHKTFSIDKEVEVNIVNDPIQLTINQAIPCALVVNEVVTNIFKHAFKDTDTGRIDAEVKEIGDFIELIIKDNGCGISVDYITKSSPSLGMHIIEALSVQLEGEYNIEGSDNGTVFSMNFKRSDITGIGRGAFG